MSNVNKNNILAEYNPFDIKTYNTDNDNVNNPIIFVKNDDNRKQPLFRKSNLSYNPSTDTLNLVNINVSGTGVSELIDVTDTDLDNNYYITFVSDTGTKKQLRADSTTTALSYNPATSTINISGKISNGVYTIYFNTGKFGNFIKNSSTNDTHRLLFTENTSPNGRNIFENSNLTYNPSTNVLSVVNISVSGTGVSELIDITDTDLDNNYYITFVDDSGTKKILRADTTTNPLSYNPSTSTINIDGKITNGVYTIYFNTGKFGNFIKNSSTNDTHRLLFTEDTSPNGRNIFENANLSYNPNTNILSVGNLSANLSTIDGSLNNLDLKITMITNTPSTYNQLLYTDLTYNPITRIFKSQTIKAGNNGGIAGNHAALLITSTGTASTDASIAIQQVTTEGDTIIFADYEPFVEYGINTDNSSDAIDFTGGTTTGNLGSKTLYNNSGSTRTAYIKSRFELNSGNFLCGGNLVAGNNSISTGEIKMNYLRGGYGNVANNFHIDNHTAAGTMLLNYNNEQIIRCFNQGTTGYFAVYTNAADGIYYQTTNGGAGTQWNGRLRLHNTNTGHSVFLGDFLYGGIYSQGIHSHKNTMTTYNILYLNGYETSSNYWAVAGEKVFTPTLWIGCDVSSGLAHQGNNRLLKLGRSASFTYGMKFGGWTGTAELLESVFQMSNNTHCDCAINGDFYFNLYSGKFTRVYGFINASDRRIKKNITPYDDDELMNQIMNLEITTYNYKDKRFQDQNGNKQLGFIADSLENQSYFKYAFKISNYDIPYDEPINMDFTINEDNTIITFNNYTFDLTKTYYLYAYTENCPDETPYRTIQDKPLTVNTFKNPFTTLEDNKTKIIYSKIELIGELVSDCKNVSKEKLVAGAYGGLQILNRKIKKLEEKNDILENRVIELENQLNLIKEHLNLI